MHGLSFAIVVNAFDTVSVGTLVFVKDVFGDEAMVDLPSVNGASSEGIGTDRSNLAFITPKNVHERLRLERLFVL